MKRGGTSDESDEQHRYACECKYWFEKTGGNPALIKAAIDRIAKKRGKAGAEKVRAGLMEIWRAKRGNK